MNRVFVLLHVSLLSTILRPLLAPEYLEVDFLRRLWRDDFRLTWGDFVPLDTSGFSCSWTGSILPFLLATSLPAVLALLNLPLILRAAGYRSKACSSMSLGLLSTSLMSLLLAQYGYGRNWGAWVIWILGVLLVIAGTAAVARLKFARAPLSMIRDA